MKFVRKVSSYLIKIKLANLNAITPNPLGISHLSLAYYLSLLGYYHLLPYVCLNLVHDVSTGKLIAENKIWIRGADADRHG